MSDWPKTPFWTRLMTCLQLPHWNIQRRRQIFLEDHSDMMRGDRQNLEYGKLQLAVKKLVFLPWDGQTLEEVSQRDCEISALGRLQDSSGHKNGQPNMRISVLSMCWACLSMGPFLCELWYCWSVTVLSVVLKSCQLPFSLFNNSYFGVYLLSWPSQSSNCGKWSCSASVYQVQSRNNLSIFIPFWFFHIILKHGKCIAITYSLNEIVIFCLITSLDL